MTEHRINIMQDEISAAPASQPQEQKVTYASVSERFVALLIDYGVIFLSCQFLVWLWAKIAHPELTVWQAAALIVSINALFVFYEAIFSCGDRMTLGKALVGIAVVKKDLSGPISFGRALFRAVGYYISGILFMCGFFLAFFDDRHRTLHDVFGGSVVVQIRQKSMGESALLRLVGGILLIVFAWTSYKQFLGGGAIVDQYLVRQAQRHLRNVGLLEEGHYRLYGYYTNDLLRLSLLSGDPVQFQRDTQKILRPKGFKIGVTKDGYKITAVAKDKKHTQVFFASPEK